MAISTDGDDGQRALPPELLAAVAPSSTPDQRYCLECGERRGAIPAAVASWLSIVAAEPSRMRPAQSVAADPVADDAEEEDSQRRFMPEPRSAAVAVMGMLGFGVLLGSA